MLIVGVLDRRHVPLFRISLRLSRYTSSLRLALPLSLSACLGAPMRRRSRVRTAFIPRVGCVHVVNNNAKGLANSGPKIIIFSVSFSSVNVVVPTSLLSLAVDI